MAILGASILGEMAFINTSEVCSLRSRGTWSGNLSSLVLGLQPQDLPGLRLLSRQVEYGMVASACLRASGLLVGRPLIHLRFARTDLGAGNLSK
jgi:putative copper export protein